MELDLDLNKYMNYEHFNVFKGGNIGSFGTSLLEVFNVRITKQTEVYGTFRVEDTQGTLDFFTRPSTDIVSFKAMGTLPLTKPSRVIPAAGTITFHLDLKDKHGKEFIKGSFPLNLMDESTPCEGFDEYLVAHIKGIQSSARIYYTIPFMALQYVIKIQLIKGDNGMGHSYVTGRIIARYGNDYDNSADEDIKKYSWFLLYDKSSEDEHFELKDEDFLPLLRSSFVVPGRTSVVIIKLNVEVHHSNGHSETLVDYEIKFRPCIYRHDDEDIELNGGTTLRVMTQFVHEFRSV